MRPPFDLEAMVAGIHAADRGTLGRAITLVESKHPDDRAHAHQLLARLAPDTGRAHRIGITGVPGVGKSTFIDAFGLALCGGAAPTPASAETGLRLGVLAVDPTSERTGGSILGDKTRMPHLAIDPRAFIRPSPAGGTLGGVAARTREATLVIEAAGCTHILIETVGVGQSETAVAHLVDTFVLLALPGAGDELQGIKRGIMEMADLVVVTKADGDLERPAHRAAAQLRAALRLLHPAGDPPEVLVTSALQGLGIADVLRATQAHFALIERISARPRSPARSRSSLRSTSRSPANGAPSIGVLRFATKGAQPKSIGTIFESSVPSRTSSSRSSSVSPGRPTIR